MKNINIDNGKEFNWGKTSQDYAKYRDVYPEEFYKKLLEAGIGGSEQNILDIGTGTGVIPRNMYKYGADFVGIDISENQIEQAKRLAKENNQDIKFFCMSAERLDFADDTFNCATACQCYWYFDHSLLSMELFRVLKKKGIFAVMVMNWLPYEDKIAYETERLVLKYNPDWTGAGYKREYENIDFINPYLNYFELEREIDFDLEVPFTYESWVGRIRSCRGVGASLHEDKVNEFSKELLELLKSIAPEKFNILHYAHMIILRSKK